MAQNALHFAMTEQFDQCSSVLERLAAAYGGDGAIQAALMWIDTLAAKMGHDHTNPMPVALMFKAVETGELDGADDVRPKVAWAGRLITARLADDQDTFIALINLAGQKDIGPYIGELLHIVALSMQAGELIPVRKT